MKHSWYFYIPSEIKIKLFCFFTLCSSKIYNSSNQTKTSQKNKIQLTLFLTISTTRQILASLLLREKTLFTWAFWRWASLFKFSQNFKVAHHIRGARKANRLHTHYGIFFLLSISYSQFESEKVLVHLSS